jgi:signal peptidase I
MKGLLSWLVFILFVTGAILGIPRLLGWVLGTDEPMMTVTSGSMWPVLERGDLVFVQRAERENVAAGDVVVFYHDGGLAVHRVKRILGETLVTQGDANTSEDAPITYSDLVGKLPFAYDRPLKIPWVGKIALAVNPQIEAADLKQRVGEEGGVVGQLKGFVRSPLGVIVLSLVLMAVLESPLRSALDRLRPGAARRQRRQTIMRRLTARWGDARVRRSVRI